MKPAEFTSLSGARFRLPAWHALADGLALFGAATVEQLVAWCWGIDPALFPYEVYPEARRYLARFAAVSQIGCDVVEIQPPMSALGRTQVLARVSEGQPAGLSDARSRYECRKVAQALASARTEHPTVRWFPVAVLQQHCALRVPGWRIRAWLTTAAAAGQVQTQTVNARGPLVLGMSRGVRGEAALRASPFAVGGPTPIPSRRELRHHLLSVAAALHVASARSARIVTFTSERALRASPRPPYGCSPHGFLVVPERGKPGGDAHHSAALLDAVLTLAPANPSASPATVSLEILVPSYTSTMLRHKHAMLPLGTIFVATSASLADRCEALRLPRPMVLDPAPALTRGRVPPPRRRTGGTRHPDTTSPCP